VSLRCDIVILACAVSAGIHGALAPAHFAEGVGAGAGFVVATVLLAALALDLTLRPDSSFAVAGAAIVFAGLLAGYALAATTGLPLLHPDSEPVDGLALVTKGVEAVGLLTARGFRGAPVTRPIPLPLTLLVAAFAALTTLALSNGHTVALHS
jgi:hypothetical protein